MRSDRRQNPRTEALNLIRNRNGPVPHIVAVTSEPMPKRIASIARESSDLDCVYHIALPELRGAVSESMEGRRSEQDQDLEMLISAKRLR
ncbi:NgoMIV family type II restriction endonuclease [Prosthecobacter sp.]|uniref:NgoMIV family type II restriction endonuclease n=1 Tax=Prosthecobacter sp. TaxID=1965333 RepID=UPI0037847E54